MNLKLFFGCCCMLMMSFAALGQSKKSKNPTSVSPNEEVKVYAPKASKKKKSMETTHNARDKFYDRMENLEKERRKSEKNGSKPQYNQFQYFGHKRPPKKRPPEKMKFCKTCGIRH